MTLRYKFISLFLLLTITPVVIVGYLAYENGRKTIEQSTFNHLSATNIHKTVLFENWLKDKMDSLELLASCPFFTERFPAMLEAHVEGSVEHEKAHRQVNEHWQPLLNRKMFLNFMILRARDGMVVISNDPWNQGKFMDYQPFFQRGKEVSFTQEIYYDLSLQEPVLMMATPLKDIHGNLLAVLAGQINLTLLSQLMEMRNTLSATEDSYLVNSSNFFITEPRFGTGHALKKTVHSQGVTKGLTHKAGIDFYEDYRNIPVIGAYTWIERWNLCLMTEVNQSEAYAPILKLQRTILFIGGVVAMLAALLGWLFSGTMTRSLGRLVVATREITRGHLDIHLETTGNDEIATLARAFSEMSTRLKKTLVSRDALSLEVKQREKTEKELHRALSALKRSNEDLQQFAYVASHDLQEPLRMVSSYTQLLEKKYGDKLDEKGKKFIYFAVDGATRMQKLIQDLLEYSRVKTHGVQFESLAADQMLDAALINLGAAIEEAGAVVTRGPLPVINVDRTQIVQVFQNLIGNAIKFRKDRTPEVHISATHKDSSWLFSVKDNGIGISEAYKEKIFIIFQRLHTRDEYPGTGIGLAMCRQIVNRHGGTLWFESTPGRGTTFFFTLPDKPRDRIDDEQCET